MSFAVVTADSIAEATVVDFVAVKFVTKVVIEVKLEAKQQVIQALVDHLKDYYYQLVMVA